MVGGIGGSRKVGEGKNVGESRKSVKRRKVGGKGNDEERRMDERGNERK